MWHLINLLGSKKTKFILIISIMLCISGNTLADLSFMNASRVLMQGNQREKLFEMTHNGQNTLLMQAWITTLGGDEDVPFAISPGLAKMNSGDSIKLHIIPQGMNILRQDKESAFYLYVNEVPEKRGDSASGDRVQFSFKHRFYFIWRPVSIGNNSIENAKMIKWKLERFNQNEVELIAVNPNPFYYSLMNIYLSDSKGRVKRMISEHVFIEPFSTLRLPVNYPGQEFSVLDFDVVTDIGRGVPLNVSI